MKYEDLKNRIKEILKAPEPSFTYSESLPEKLKSSQDALDLMYKMYEENARKKMSPPIDPHQQYDSSGNPYFGNSVKNVFNGNYQINSTPYTGNSGQTNAFWTGILSEIPPVAEQPKEEKPKYEAYVEWESIKSQPK